MPFEHSDPWHLVLCSLVLLGSGTISGVEMIINRGFRALDCLEYPMMSPVTCHH